MSGTLGTLVLMRNGQMSFYGELQITCDAQLSQFSQLAMFDLRPVELRNDWEHCYPEKHNGKFYDSTICKQSSLMERCPSNTQQRKGTRLFLSHCSSSYSNNSTHISHKIENSVSCWTSSVCIFGSVSISVWNCWNKRTIVSTGWGSVCISHQGAFGLSLQTLQELTDFLPEAEDST